MRKMLAMFVLGVSILLPAAAAFAEAGDDHHPDRPNTYTPAPVMLQTEPTNPGTVAGTDQSVPIWMQQRYDNYGQ